MKNFILFGVGGYIAPRHLKAIQDTGNKLVAAFDVNDSVGVIDSYFPNANFYLDFVSFKNYLDKYMAAGNKIDFASICSPNNFHKQQIEFCLKRNINVICEKPLVLNESDIDELQRYEERSEARVYTILQLRLHDAIKKLKQDSVKNLKEKEDIELTYITSRGPWYLKSWKGDSQKSGGLATNIGVHFFDMLGYVYGDHIETTVKQNSDTDVSGFTKYQNANVKWFLSIDSNNLPERIIDQGKMTYRSIKINGVELEFSTGFTELHTQSYKNILNNEGFGLEENRLSINIVESIRNAFSVDLEEHKK